MVSFSVFHSIFRMQTRLISSSLLAIPAAALLLQACKEKPDGSVSPTGSAASAPTGASEATATPGPAYPKEVQEELVKLSKLYPEAKVEEEMTKLHNYENAQRILESDLPVLVRELTPLVSCSRGGHRLFFQKDRLAHEAPAKLTLLTMAESSVRKVFKAMEEMGPEDSPEAIQRLYVRMRLIERCEGRAARLAAAYGWREKRILPKLKAAVDRGGDEGHLLEVRPAAKLIAMLESRSGIFSEYPENEAGMVGSPHETGLETGIRGVEQEEGAQWQPEQTARIAAFEKLRRKFQIDDLNFRLKYIDIAIVNACERDIARRLKLFEMWHTALTEAGRILESWLPPDWEGPASPVEAAELAAIVNDGTPPPRPAAFQIYTTDAAFEPLAFAEAVESDGRAELVRGALVKDAVFPLGVTGKWSIDEMADGAGNFLEMPRGGPMVEPSASGTPFRPANARSLLARARLLLEGDAEKRDPLMAVVLLYEPEIRELPQAVEMRTKALSVLTPEQRRMEALLKNVLTAD